MKLSFDSANHIDSLCPYAAIDSFKTLRWGCDTAARCDAVAPAIKLVSGSQSANGVAVFQIKSGDQFDFADAILSTSPGCQYVPKDLSVLHSMVDNQFKAMNNKLHNFSRGFEDQKLTNKRVAFRTIYQSIPFWIRVVISERAFPKKLVDAVNDFNRTAHNGHIVLAHPKMAQPPSSEGFNDVWAVEFITPDQINVIDSK